MPASKRSRLKKPNPLTLIIIALAIVIIIFTALNLFSPQDKRPIPPAQISTPQPSVRNLTGIYKGNLPCADCSGIEETLALAGTEPTSGTYILEDVYQGKSITPFRIQGKWTLYNNIIKLAPNDNSQVSYFQILDNGNLQMLDSEMKKIDSPFNQILTRQN